MSNWENWLKTKARDRESKTLERLIEATEEATEPWTVRNGKRLLNFSSNNYLGLSKSPSLQEAAIRGAKKGAGSGGSRLITGDNADYRRLEEKIAELKGTKRALILGSGYLANIGTFSALLDENCGVISDSLNHASIIDGIRLSRATKYIYQHTDISDLEAKLSEAKHAGHKRLLIATETVFSMDGDVAPLKDIIELKNEFGAALLVDDAHGAGVFGKNGAGYAHEVGLAEHIEIQMGTFSKAYGAYGAYIAANEEWICELVNSSRTLIYSTGLPPSLIETANESLKLVSEADRARSQLAQKAKKFRQELNNAGLDTCGSSTQIIPVIVGENDLALHIAQRLRARNLLAHAIRPPTVPDGTARIRFSLMATHPDNALEEASRVIIEEIRNAEARKF